MQIKIENKLIGDKQPCFIIAEAGVNHNGDFERAKELIDIAKEANADAVKFQTWITEENLTKTVEQATYQIQNTGKLESQFDMIKRLELSFEQFKKLKKYADNKKIMFLSTPDDEKSVDFLDELGVPAFKIGSGELTNIFMLKKVAEKQKPIILSTGMANLEEIQDAIEIIYKANNKNLILLHCTSQYPTDFRDVNLKAMITLKKKFNTLVGYSDHTIGDLVPQLAVDIGACVIEKHFTFNKNAEGPDHKCSLNPIELKEMVEKIRTVELILGKDIKEPTAEELQISKLVRKTVVAKVNIPKGIKITEDMLTVKRSNGTLQPKDLKEIISKISIKSIKKDEPLNKREELYPNALKLNSGRNALLYILKTYKPSKVYIPYYICDAVLEPITKTNTNFEFYHINKEFQPEIPSNFQEYDFLLYVNYFGINDFTIKRLAKRIKNLITDNSQAFYSPPIKLPTFYSPRKFFGVPDGSYLFTDIYLNEELEQSFSYEKSSHLIKKHDLGLQKCYEDYKQIEASFSTEPLKRMSNLTQNILSSLDYEKIKLIRERNFSYIHDKLKKLNELNINTQNLNGPMKYPFLIGKEGIKEFLIKNNIFVSTYWEDVFKRVNENSFEYYISNYLIPLPIDQRYNLDDMNIVIEKIKEIL